MVDVVGGLGIEVAERVVAYSGEVDNSVEPGEVVALDSADVFADRFDLRRGVAHDAGSEQVGVEADDVVAGLLQHRDEHRADVAVMAGDEYAQVNLRRLMGRPEPRPH